mmetsp:Transcript_28999/g.55594  ORF Transcript_28999/g.55594 Transcript_28999/m.55594 type:complete len:1292 (+) Transcript_28999:258-4133(+)
MRAGYIFLHALLVSAAGWGVGDPSDEVLHTLEQCHEEGIQEADTERCMHTMNMDRPSSASAQDAVPVKGKECPQEDVQDHIKSCSDTIKESDLNCQEVPSETTRGVGTGVDGSEILVRFHDYKHQEEHRIALEAALASARTSGWEWIARHNPAARFPTDFGLIKLSDDLTVKGLQAMLVGVPFVKSVTAQQRIHRSLLARHLDRHLDRHVDQSTSEDPSPPRSHSRSEDVAPLDARDSGAGVEAEAWSPPEPVKGPGRLQTKSSFDVHADRDVLVWPEVAAGNLTSDFSSRHLLSARRSITDAFQASALWQKGFSGAKVRMAVFDTGVRSDHPHFRHIKERSNWTHENTLNDGLGHGTFVAGLIASQVDECHGFAPDAEIHAFRVFTNDQVSYTSWFLDAFNYAIATDMHIVNLSIGGPDYLDAPFVEKVWELTANNVIMVSAIGNDGPLYGTLNNPADQMDVIGVGGIDYSDHIAPFSSRGMSTWELPAGYGRVKPDVVAYGRDVTGSKIAGGCRSLSGTSVASPVVAGAVVLLSSVIDERKRWDVLNPAVLKQALVESATPLTGPHIHEQGAGKLNLLGAYSILAAYKPRASVVPSHYDLTSAACPYMWPYCRQPLYHSAMPTILNATILNGMGLTGWLEAPPEFVPGRNGQHLEVTFDHPERLWPWAGYLAIYIRVGSSGKDFQGTAEGTVRLRVASPPGRGETSVRRSEVLVPLKASVVPVPPRRMRLLWDNYHSVRYPPGYIPRDSLDVRQDILDWHGDHPHTNFHDMFEHLRNRGYYVEMLGSPFTCFDAANYHALLLVDAEEEYHPEEKEKLRLDVETRSLSLLVFADWYNVDTMVKMRFFDDNTRSWWTPATGGANVPALNDLLQPFGIAFGDVILNGNFQLAKSRISYASGSNIARFPKDGVVFSFPLSEKTSPQARPGGQNAQAAKSFPILGLYSPKLPKAGRIAVYGDSNCLDSSHMNMGQNCFALLSGLLEFAASGSADPAVFPRTSALQEPLGGPTMALPVRRTDIDFSEYSRVMHKPAVCGREAPVHFASKAAPAHSADTAADNSHPAPKAIYPNITADLGAGARGKNDASDGRPVGIEAADSSVKADALPGVSATPLAAQEVVVTETVDLSGTIDAGPQDHQLPPEKPDKSTAVGVPAQLAEDSNKVPAGAVPAQLDEDANKIPDGVVPVQLAEDPDALDENAQLQSATVATIVHSSSRVDPTHRAENEEFGMEFGVLDSRVKYMLALTGGILVGAMVGASRRLSKRAGPSPASIRHEPRPRKTKGRSARAALLSK